MDIPLLQYMRPGFPKFRETENAASYTIEYVGPEDRLTVPRVGDTWGDFPGIISDVDPQKLGMSGYAILTVTVEEKFGDSSAIGIVTEVAYELEWAMIRRPLAEHPKFASGGGNALTTEDLVLLQLWRDEPSTDDKIAFKVSKRDADGNRVGSAVTLSTNAQRYAKYVLLGIESFDDYAPVARKTKTYAGGPPPAAAAGSKTSLFGGFPNPPSGTWEWVKSADRAVRAAGQRKWVESEELTGAFKVLIDNTNLYL